MLWINRWIYREATQVRLDSTSTYVTTHTHKHTIFIVSGEAYQKLALRVLIKKKMI
jgi:hypothetical protein